MFGFSSCLDAAINDFLYLVLIVVLYYHSLTSNISLLLPQSAASSANG